MSTVSFDADSIKTRLKERLQAKESWKDVLFYSTNQRLIDIFAEELAYDVQYAEILATEAKWSLAQQRSSLMPQTQLFDYTPYRKTGASGTLKVSSSEDFDASYGTTISIPKYSVFSSDDLDFCCTETTSISTSEEYGEISISQGTPLTETFTAEGDEYETFYIYNDSIENSVLDVYVNGTAWTEIDYIREAEDTDSQNYVIKNISDFSGISIQFGNDYYGKKLTASDVVKVYYLETEGSDSNVDSADIITSVTSTIYDSNGDTVTVYCTNDDAVSGGLDYEDIEDIRAFAPRAYLASDRAVSKSDYQSIVEDLSFISKATVWGETEINEDAGNVPGTYVSTSENRVYISAISTDAIDLTDTQEDLVRDELDEKKAPTDLVEFESVIFTYLYFTTTAYVSDTSYTLSTVSADISDTLEDTYSTTNMDFKETIHYSDYVSLIDGIDGVDYHDTEVSFYTLSTFSSAYTATISLAMEDIEASSVKIYVITDDDDDYTQIAYDDGDGNLTGYGDYTLDSSTIDYDSGEGSIIVSDGLDEGYGSYTIKTEFSVTATNIIPTLRYQIICYGDSAISTEYED